jgi:hypothetical protein
MANNKFFSPLKYKCWGINLPCSSITTPIFQVLDCLGEAQLPILIAFINPENPLRTDNPKTSSSSQKQCWGQNLCNVNCQLSSLVKTQTLKRNPEQQYDQNLVQWKDTNSMGMNPNFPFVELSRERPTFCKLWWQSWSKLQQAGSNYFTTKRSRGIKDGFFPLTLAADIRSWILPQANLCFPQVSKHSLKKSNLWLMTLIINKV